MEICSGSGEDSDVQKFGFCEFVNLLVLRGCKILLSLNNVVVYCT